MPTSTGSPSPSPKSNEPDHERNDDNLSNHNRLRSNLAGTIRLIRSLEFTDGHKSQIQRTPFWSLIEAILDDKFTAIMTRKYDLMVYDISKKFKSSPTNAFYFGDKVVRIQPTDIKMLFGICCGERPFPPTQKGMPKSPFMSRICKDGKRLTANSIKRLLSEKLGKTRRTDMEDAARLLILYLCVNVFFSTSGAFLSWQHIRVVENLDIIKQYDWASAICSYLISSLVKTSTKPSKLNGCTVAILYWWCEHTSIINRIGNEDQIPRILKWSLADLRKRMKAVSLNDPIIVEMIKAEVEMTAAEKELLHVETISNENETNDFIDSPHETWMRGTDGDNIDGDNTTPTHFDAIDELINIAEKAFNTPTARSTTSRGETRGGIDVRNSGDSANKKQALKDENNKLRVYIEQLKIKVKNQTDMLVQERQQTREIHIEFESKKLELSRVIKIQKLEIENLQATVKRMKIDKQKEIDETDADFAHVVTQVAKQSTSRLGQHQPTPSESPKVSSMIKNLKGKKRKASRLPDCEYSSQKEKDNTKCEGRGGPKE